MNTTTAATRLTQAVMIAATLAAGFMAQAADSCVGSATKVVTMPTVVVTGHRDPAAVAVVQMPQVMVIGQRSQSAVAVVTMPEVTVIGQRAQTSVAVVTMPQVTVIGQRSEAAQVLARKDEAVTKARPA